MKSPRPDTLRVLAAALLLPALGLCACSRKEAAALPVLSDPGAGLTLTLPATATAFTRHPAAKDRFVYTIPYDARHALIYLQTYSLPLVLPGRPPVSHKDVVGGILRDELGSFLDLETSFTNLPDQTPVLLLYGRGRDPERIAGFAFQCNKTHFIFIGLASPDLGPADVAPFFQTCAASLRIADINQSTLIDSTQYRAAHIDATQPTQALEFIRNIFASRNTNPVNYVLAINYAYLLCGELLAASPDSPHLAETVALLNNMSAIRLADYLKARRDFEVAYGQGNATEALAQARFLDDLAYPFDAETRTLGKQRIRKALAMQ